MRSGHLCDYLENSAAQFPDGLAAIDPDGASLTYRELDHHSSCIAGYLADCGVRRGDRVGLLLPKSIHSLTALFGALKAGAAYVPADWSGPAERIRTILSDCGVRALFLDPRRPELADIAETTIRMEADFHAALEHAPLAGSLRDPNDLAYILYTSGSTGIPKGVMLSHRNATSFVNWCSEVFCPTPEDRFSSHAPFHFDLSVLDIYVPLKHGASIHLIPDELGKNPKELASFIAGRKLTVWYSTPAILGLLADFGNLARLDCSRLRLVLFAGEVFPPQQLRRIVAQWPNPAYFNLYGPTETNVCTFAQIPTPVPAERTEPYPIGSPCSHCSALVLDSDLRPIEPGEEGLLFISGEPVFSGYWGREEESAGRFVIRDGIRWYNTGDVVIERAETGFTYVGRRDRMVKRRGYRIELGEVESCLWRHPGLSEAAAIAVADPQAGTRIVGYLAARNGARPSIVEMKTFCNRHLPSYMSPDVFLFVDALPRTSTNKVDYQALIRNFQPAERA